MQVFRRAPSEIVMWVLFALIGAFIAFVAAWSAGWHLALQILLPLAVAAPFAWFVLYRDNITVRVSNKGTLEYSRAGRVVHRFNLKQSHITLQQAPKNRAPRGPRGYTLSITPPGATKPLRLDCAPLGSIRFKAFCDALARFIDA